MEQLTPLQEILPNAYLSLNTLLYGELNSKQFDEYNELCKHFGVIVDKPIVADLVNLRAAYRSENDCDKCKKGNKRNTHCYKSSVIILDGRIKLNKQLCNVEEVERAMARTGVPRRFQSTRMTDYRTTNFPLIDAIQKVINDGKGIFLYGAVGTGKTMLSSIIAVERAYMAKPSLFYTVTDMLEDLRDFDNPLARSEKLSRVQNCSCLIIDDLGAEHVTDWVSATLFSVLDSRYKKNLMTVINSNLDLDGITKRYTSPHGDRIARRIESLCQVVNVK